MIEYNDVVEQWTVRDNESYYLYKAEPDTQRWLAIQKVFVELPEGSQEYNQKDYRIAAAQKDEGGDWQWVFLSPLAQKIFSDLTEKVECGVWVYISIKETERE